jgi:hypothetical protein
MITKTLQDAIMAQLESPEHEALHDAAERLNTLGDEVRERQNTSNEKDN